MKRRNESHRTRLSLAALVTVVTLGAVFEGCATTKGEGSETHFIMCKTTTDCTKVASDSVCVKNLCSNAKDCNGTSAVSCPEFCGSDVFSESVCVGGAWTCPPNTVPVDSCPPNTCFVPPSAATCCTTNGERRTGICPDVNGEDVQCPQGSFHVDAECNSVCAVTTVSSPPAQYSVTFQFTNASNAGVAVWSGCTLEYDITTCADAYATPLPKSVFCESKCPSVLCGSCGACNDAPDPVTSTISVNDVWQGELDYSELSTDGRCGCYDAVPAPPGQYRVTVPVYSSTPAMLPAGGFDKQVLYKVSVDFTLADQANVVVTVPIDHPSGSDAGP